MDQALKSHLDQARSTVGEEAIGVGVVGDKVVLSFPGEDKTHDMSPEDADVFQTALAYASRVARGEIKVQGM